MHGGKEGRCHLSVAAVSGAHPVVAEALQGRRVLARLPVVAPPPLHVYEDTIEETVRYGV